MTKATASRAAQVLRELGMLVSPSLAGLTTVIAFERGRLSLYRVLDDEELVELVRQLQLLHAGEGRGLVSVGDASDAHKGELSSAHREESVRGRRSPVAGMKGGGQ